MTTEIEPEPDEIEESPAVTLAVILIVFALLTICTLGLKLLSRLLLSRPATPQVVPVVTLPTGIPTVLPTAIPVKIFTIYLPVIMVESDSASEQVWKITYISNLGYELDSRRYDLGTFQRVDSQDTADGYCINSGWDTPAIGTEYLLNAEGIFVPLHQPTADPIQRFLKIQK